MPWDEFKVTFDKLCVCPKPTSSEVESGPSTIPLRRGPEAELDLCLSLTKMAPVPLRRELRQVTVTFDPYVTMPKFLEDGTLETRLRWEASKPGHLQQLLEANKNNGRGPSSSYAMLQRMVEAEGLAAALGPTGCYQAGHCRWRPVPRQSLKQRLAEVEAKRASSWLPSNPVTDAAEGCVVS
ncbi:IQUB [Symbiodinium pilosum]|uniref:IQUB protein n=1 Tax=Symbiodinium pilosum TaxID=2952 RepID=A0A812W8K4_SYMPI|nr:IQUB [Symbiodinium pilosum]